MTDSNGHEQIGDFNGHSLDEIVNFFQMSYEPAHSDSHAGAMHAPMIERQKRIQGNVSDLEGTVKDTLGKSEKATKAQAQEIAKKLAYEVAKVDGYHGEMKDLDDQKVRQYLSQAANATGDPTIGNKWAFVKSIMDMDSAKPGSLGYNSDSALGHLISYLAQQKDEEARKIQHYRTLVAEQWAEPGTGIKLQKAFGSRLKIPLAETATAQEFFQDLERVYSPKNQAAYAESQPKTYRTQPPAAAQPQGTGQAHSVH